MMSRIFGYLLVFLAVIFSVASARQACAYYSKDASAQMSGTYWPNFEQLLIKEGDDKYPMPASSSVTDLLPSLRGVAGLAVHTMPDTTVTEGQGYAMLSAGMRKDVAALKGLTVAWQANGQGFSDTPPCGGCGGPDDAHFPPKDICTKKEKSPCLCNTVKGAYMAGWNMPFTTLGSMGSATDGDEDAVSGLIFLAELTGEQQFREYAVRSITAFILEDLGYADAAGNSRPVPVVGDIPEPLQTMYLWRGGSCWGGYDTTNKALPDDRNLCINPAYFSPGEWRLFKKYLAAHADLVPAPYTAEELGNVLESAIVWGYNTINRITCDSGLVSNWWTVPNQGWPWKGELKCQNSGTQKGAYYSDAARIPWRVTLDYLWFGDEATAPLYNEQGSAQGFWGAKEYSKRWADAWRNQIVSASPKGSYPPFDSAVLKLRKDQVLPLLSKVETCDKCPDGFMASPWNGWGSYPVVTAYQIPQDGMDPADEQQWLDFLSLAGFEGCQNKQYFDLGQEIVIGVMLSGNLWLPLPQASSTPSCVPGQVSEPAVAASSSMSTQQHIPPHQQEQQVSPPSPSPPPQQQQEQLTLPSIVSPHSQGARMSWTTFLANNPDVSKQLTASNFADTYHKAWDVNHTAVVVALTQQGYHIQGQDSISPARLSMLPDKAQWQQHFGHKVQLTLKMLLAGATAAITVGIGAGLYRARTLRGFRPLLESANA